MRMNNDGTANSEKWISYIIDVVVGGGEIRLRELVWVNVACRDKWKKVKVQPRLSQRRQRGEPFASRASYVSLP